MENSFAAHILRIEKICQCFSRRQNVCQYISGKMFGNIFQEKGKNIFQKNVRQNVFKENVGQNVSKENVRQNVFLRKMFAQMFL
jgi:hypothetical protein